MSRAGDFRLRAIVLQPDSTSHVSADGLPRWVEVGAIWLCAVDQAVTMTGETAQSIADVSRRYLARAPNTLQRGVRLRIAARTADVTAIVRDHQPGVDLICTREGAD